MGCWLGKAVGGTLGMPFEGQDGPLDLEFYRPVPTEMLPNDDLDLQVVWACVLDEMETPRVDRHLLAAAWQRHVHFPWDEYGVALRNYANGLHPPLTGAHDNWFSHGMGATIRSEIWACLAPGKPALAAAYAYEDACFDHAGCGIEGETFFAALESMAFVESDPQLLLNGALETLPPESLVRRAVQDTRDWWEELRDWQEVRELILARYGHENFTDVTMNMAFTVLGWLAGEGDFSKAICIAVNCGKDTDCTGATVGALMGILDPNCIPDKWLAPIGRELVLSPGIVGLRAPATLDEFTALVLRLRDRLAGYKPNARHYVQKVDHLQVRAQVAFAATLPEIVPVFSSDHTWMALEGTFSRMQAECFDEEWLLLHLPFQVEKSGEVLLMFNTGQECRVWVDGKLLLERGGGVMAPSLHRAPEHQKATRVLAEGQHSLVAAIRRPASGHTAQWVVAAGDPDTKQWHPRAFVSPKSHRQLTPTSHPG